jgi:hypothetical protein
VEGAATDTPFPAKGARGRAPSIKLADVGIGASPSLLAASFIRVILRWHPRMARKLHHNVYVILLDSAVAEHPSIRRLNPRRDPSKPCVYVGMTGLAVEERFENHKQGHKSSWVVKRYGVRLMPEFYAHLNPMPFEAAAQMEKDLAEDLRVEGYTVTGGT